MTPKRRALNALTKPWLLTVARHFELDVRANDSVDQLRDAIAQSKRAKLGAIFPEFPRDLLKEICRELEIDDSGKEKQPIVDRIAAKLGGTLSVEPAETPEPPPVPESKKKPPEPEPMRSCEDDPDLHGRYTLKRWRVAEVAADGAVTAIDLVPDNGAFKARRMTEVDGDLRVVAELLEVLG